LFRREDKSIASLRRPAAAKKTHLGARPPNERQKDSQDQHDNKKALLSPGRGKGGEWEKELVVICQGAKERDAKVGLNKRRR